MLALDHFSIGSRGNVRGFDGSAMLLAENGFAWRNELTMPVQIGEMPAVGIWRSMPVGFGGASSNQLIGTHLAGAALGARSQ